MTAVPMESRSSPADLPRPYDPPGRAIALAWVAEQMARFEEDRNLADRTDVPRRRNLTGPTVVYSIRLGPDEVAELERRAEIVNLPPTVLARQFLRAGIYAEDDLDGEDETLSTLADRLARDSATLRQMLDSGAR